MRYGYSTARLFKYASAILVCSSFLTGCASVNSGKSPVSFEDLYKRISYKTEGRYRVIDIYYATTRDTYPDKDSQLRFKSTMGEALTDGKLEVKIDPGIRIGKMMPMRFKRKGEIGIQDVNRSEEDAFLKDLSAAVQSSPHKSLLVLVFGFKDDFEATAIKAAYFSYLLDVNTPVLLFDWPGDQSVTPAGYKKAQSYAKASGSRMGELLTKIIRQVKPEKLWIEASSMGCQVVCDAFDQMYKNDDLKDSESEIAHVFLAAPDVGEDEFNVQFKDELEVMAEHTTTYVASNDMALLISGIINDDKRLGRQKVKAKEQEQLEETKDMLYLKSLSPDRLALIDVTPINKASYGHGYYLEDPEFFDDVYSRMFGNRPQANRRLYLLKYEGKTDYWVLKGNN
jgi:esterase/lipase superfamily enzyme